MSIRRLSVLGALGVAGWLMPTPAQAVPEESRFSAAGYLRIMARPDLEGAGARLGLWNLHGRLLNEGPYAALELKLDALPKTAQGGRPWASIHAKIEGDSIHGADERGGRLDAFRMSQLYVKAGDVLVRDVTFQLGTLHTYFGDMGLYDMRPSDLFYDTVGLSATYSNSRFDWLVGVGDAGYGMKGDAYHSVLSVGTSLRLRLVDGLEIGVGGEYFFEPEARGHRNAAYATPLPEKVTYEDYARREVAERFFEQYPNQRDLFPKPEALSASSYKLVGYVGFGGFGPLRWNSFYANFLRKHPEGFYDEQVGGDTYRVYTHDLTDERHELNIGNEMQLTVWPGHLDLAWGVLYGYHFDDDDTVTASEGNRTIYSTVLRGQLYLTDTVHWLTEGSISREESRQGNLWRGHYDSVFQSSGGLADTEGFEFGDLSKRDTWQVKAGFVINPAGQGIFTRPSIRLLYGLQVSNMHNAFGNSFVESLADFDEFQEDSDRLMHQLIALEAEAWF